MKKYLSMSPLHKHALTLIPAWMNNHMPSKVYDEITNPFPNFNVYNLKVCEWIPNFIIYNGCIYLSVMGLN